MVIIKPKKPFLDWINSLPGMNDPCDIENLKKDCTAILLPVDLDTDEESLNYIKKIHKKIFENELDGWCSDRKIWPKALNFALFTKWFDLEFHSEIFDSLETDIEKEEY
jgi:hypothetical protein